MTGTMTRWREVTCGGIARARGVTCLSRRIVPCTSFERFFLVGLARMSGERSSDKSTSWTMTFAVQMVVAGQGSGRDTPVADIVQVRGPEHEADLEAFDIGAPGGLSCD